ncbi:MAG: carboxypeptidase-like regulatory domain-containing protein [Bacteroidota bacterium]
MKVTRAKENRLISIAGIALLFLTFSVSPLLSQEEKPIVQMDGIVMNIKFEPLPFAHLLILNKKRGTISDADGRFSFVTEAGDSIAFSSVGYKTSIYVVPESPAGKIIQIRQVMVRDTICLGEALVCPWDSYDEFKRDFINMEYVNDDMERAYRNLAMVEEQMIYNWGDMPAVPNGSYRAFMAEKVYDKMYYAGQGQPISVFNVAAWAKFFEALKNGDFKRSKYKKSS